jgi:aminoglycoside N3'-acetyltransferase
MIFRKRKTAQDPKFILYDQTLDIVDTYSYLGIIFKYNGTFLRLGTNL